MNSQRLACVILIGLPAAGKTTFYRERFATSHKQISKDLRPRARPDTHEREIADALAGNTSVVVDNTNATIAERAAIIRLARAHGAEVIGYFFDVRPRVAIARNRERSGRERVPNVAIFTIAKRLQEPTLAEGFDRLFQVTLTPERTFDVHEAEGAGGPGTSGAR